ncbi:MAG: hypothetical protein ACLRK4_15955 [Ruthenibacterium lactatiformans]
MGEPAARRAAAILTGDAARPGKSAAEEAAAKGESHALRRKARPLPSPSGGGVAREGRQRQSRSEERSSNA